MTVPANIKTRQIFFPRLKKEHYPKIEAILLEQDIGPGICRNIGVLKDE
jgi:hypothetical protein